MARPVEIDAVELMGRMTIEVTIIKQKEMRIRLWIAKRLIMLAGLVTGMGIGFVDEDQEVDDAQG